MTRPQDSFWAALRESFLQWVIGQHMLEAWRAEKKQREECERIARMHCDEAYRAMMENKR